MSRGLFRGIFMWSFFGLGCATYPNWEYPSRDSDIVRSHIFGNDIIKVQDLASMQLASSPITEETIKRFFDLKARPTDGKTVEISFKECSQRESVFSQWHWPLAVLTVTVFPFKRQFDCEVRILFSGTPEVYSSSLVFTQWVGLGASLSRNGNIFSTTDRDRLILVQQALAQKKN